MVIKNLGSENLNNLSHATELTTQNLISISLKCGNSNVQGWIHNLWNIVQNEIQVSLLKDYDKAIKCAKILSFYLPSVS